MQSKVHILGHPIHPILIVFPLGLLPASLLTDLAGHLSGEAFWGTFSFWLIVAGGVGGLAAGLVGFIDWWHLPRKFSRARRIGAAHGLSNLGMIGLFTASAVLRHGLPENPPLSAIGLSVGGLLLGFLGGWLGGELVFRLGIGVHEDTAARERSA